MKSIKKTALLISILVLASSAMYAKNFSYSVDYLSSYIWRGFDLNAEKKPALQQSVTYALGSSGLSLNFWSSLSFTDDSENRNEFDLTVDYSTDLSPMASLSAGFIHYGWYMADNFKMKDNTTQELYAGVSLKTLLAPTLTIYYDMNNGSGLYANLAISHSIAVSKKASIDLGASLGFNGKQWIDASGFSDVNFTIAVPVSLGELTVKPQAGLTIRLMDEVKQGGDSAVLYAGLGISY